MTNRSTVFAVLICTMLICLSCKKTSKEEEIQEYAVEQSSTQRLESGLSIPPLNAQSQELVKDWQEYQEMKRLVEQYQSISKTDALLNSQELAEKAQQLKDSIRVDKLDIPSVRMRLNVLHSEVKRLEDMSTIPGISEAEILAENQKVLEAFSALNMKINNMNSQELINKRIGDFIEEVMQETDSVEPQE